MARILLIDDDRLVRETITAFLAGEGHRVIEARDGRSGVQLAVAEMPDLTILDVGLPDCSGFHVCRELRRLHVDSPVLMLTGHDQVEDRVSGLDAGADDYLLKPPDERELMARIRALLRREQRSERQPGLLQIDDITVDFGRRTATRSGAPLKLTKIEFALLELLAKSEGRPVSRVTILGNVWGYTRIPETRTVDTHVWRLRKKLGDNAEARRRIKLIAGQGYALVVPKADGAHE